MQESITKQSSHGDTDHSRDYPAKLFFVKRNKNYADQRQQAHERDAGDGKEPICCHPLTPPVIVQRRLSRRRRSVQVKQVEVNRTPLLPTQVGRSVYAKTSQRSALREPTLLKEPQGIGQSQSSTHLRRKLLDEGKVVAIKTIPKVESIE